MWLYNIGIYLYQAVIGLLSPWQAKARMWHEGRKGLFERMTQAIGAEDRVVWVHAASLGEFEQGRPIIEQIRRDYPHYKILLTFFSPSGYEIRKNYEGADYIFYLPADLPGNVRRFLDIVKPEAAIFVKYEFWLNMLAELRRREVKTYIVSAIFRPECRARMPLRTSLRRRISFAVISMSVALPSAPPEGWWIMMRAFGSAWRSPLRPAVSGTAPIEAACPMQYVATGHEMNCIVS